MAKTRKTRRSRFEGISLDSLNQEIAKVTNKEFDKKEVITGLKEKTSFTTDMTPIKTPKKKKGRPKKSKRKPLNTAIEPKNKQRLDFLAMLNGGSIADQLNNILDRYFTEIEQVDELIDMFEEKKQNKSVLSIISLVRFSRFSCSLV